jgi:signal transduction histidine kinase
MFKLVRYFSVTSLIALGMASIITGWLYRDRATADLVAASERENITLTQTLAQALAVQIQPLLQSAPTLSDAALRIDPRTQQVRQAILAQIQELPIATIKIFDLQGRVVLSTHRSDLGQDDSQPLDASYPKAGYPEGQNPGFLAARQGQVVTMLDHHDPRSQQGAIAPRQLLSSYVPLRRSGQIQGVFELYTDVTPRVEQVHQTEQFVCLANGGIWGMVYVILLLIVTRAEAALNSQHRVQLATAATLRQSEQQAQQQTQRLAQALNELKAGQEQQSLEAEKMSSLGRMLAGTAAEVSDPMHVLQGNVTQTEHYVHALLDLVHTYDTAFVECPSRVRHKAEEIDRDFLEADFPQMLGSMRSSVDRISQLILGLQHFSQVSPSERHLVRIHDILDNTLLILNGRLKPGVEVVRHYGEMPAIAGFAGPLYQVFMQSLSHALDTLSERPPESPTLTITTALIGTERMVIRIANNALSLPPESPTALWAPPFPTLPRSVSTGLGLAISRQIVEEKHGGKLGYHTDPLSGTEWVIELPF